MSDALADRYDLFIFDLDGVVFLGDNAIPGAAEAIGELRRRGLPVAYATNNASRQAPEVAQRLSRLGVPADESEVITSAQATARVLAEQLAPGSPVLVVGTDALAAELTSVGLRPVRSAIHEPVAVVQGYGSHVGWEQLAEGCVAIRGGALWVATNADRTLPSPRGPLPGNGALVAALATAVDREPDVVVGKPEPALFEQAARRHGATRPLVIGDRLDTDIEGANRARMDSLLVLTGVTTAADLLPAAPVLRPTYLADDLGGLFAPADAAPILAGGDLGEIPRTWRVRVVDGGLLLEGAGSGSDALRELCAAAWRQADAAVPDGSARPVPGRDGVAVRDGVAGRDGVAVRGAGDRAVAALTGLGLDAATAAS